MLVSGEREAMVMAPPLPCDSAVLPCFHGCLAFLHRHFPPQCPPSHPLDPSFCSQQQPSPWDYSPIPELQLPAAAPSREPASLSWVCMAVARTVWFSFHLCCFTLSLKCFLLWLRQLPGCGNRTSALVPPPAEGRSSPTNTPAFPPSSYFILPRFAWFYILFSTGQVLMSALNWYSAWTSVSEGVFLMYPWREMYSMSTCSSAILFSFATPFNV